MGAPQVERPGATHRVVQRPVQEPRRSGRQTHRLALRQQPAGVRTSVATVTDDLSPSVAHDDESRRRGWRQIREWVTVIVVAVVIATLLRTFVVQQYYIAGPSMETTLWGNDRVLVNKLAYRVGDPQRGDVIVFDRITTNGDTVQHDDLIKRVIGLSGETVEIRDCQVLINGTPIVEPWLAEVAPEVSPESNCGTANLDPVQVGENQVFLIGDNRPMSFDSRMFGPIDRDLIRGKAMLVIWPFDSITLL
ncbi:MAG: signal peptidase I [Actinobacteria bacterium]|nr:signal peptidase I [Actinomycetota bacterium]NDE66755.1 signal peptidase I [Actinomycetota bacterium]